MAGELFALIRLVLILPPGLNCDIFTAIKQFSSLYNTFSSFHSTSQCHMTFQSYSDVHLLLRDSLNQYLAHLTSTFDNSIILLPDRSSLAFMSVLHLSQWYLHLDPIAYFKSYLHMHDFVS